MIVYTLVGIAGLYQVFNLTAAANPRPVRA
jgi:uncharacterized membrane protein YuzA (DUF378 family)